MACEYPEQTWIQDSQPSDDFEQGAYVDSNQTIMTSPFFNNSPQFPFQHRRQPNFINSQLQYVQHHRQFKSRSGHTSSPSHETSFNSIPEEVLRVYASLSNGYNLKNIKKLSSGGKMQLERLINEGRKSHNKFV